MKRKVGGRVKASFMSELKKSRFSLAHQQIGVDEARVNRFPRAIPLSVSCGNRNFFSHEFDGAVPN